MNRRIYSKRNRAKAREVLGNITNVSDITTGHIYKMARKICGKRWADVPEYARRAGQNGRLDWLDVACNVLEWEINLSNQGM